jgi:hypothetical protein
MVLHPQLFDVLTADIPSIFEVFTPRNQALITVLFSIHKVTHVSAVLLRVLSQQQ